MKGGNVLFLGTVPQAYLMVDMKPTTPTTWRVDFFNDIYSEWFPVYYAQGEDFKPDQIYFIDINTYENFMEHQDIELARILNTDYTLSYESTDSFCCIYLYSLLFKNK